MNVFKSGCACVLLKKKTQTVFGWSFQNSFFLGIISLPSMQRWQLVGPPECVHTRYQGTTREPIGHHENPTASYQEERPCTCHQEGARNRETVVEKGHRPVGANHVLQVGVGSVHTSFTSDWEQVSCWGGVHRCIKLVCYVSFSFCWLFFAASIRRSFSHTSQNRGLVTDNYKVVR